MTDHGNRFFNRKQATEGLNSVVTVSSMLGTIFTGLDHIRNAGTSTVTTGILATRALGAVATFWLSRSVRTSVVAVISGSVLGLLFLAVTWPLPLGAA